MARWVKARELIRMFKRGTTPTAGDAPAIGDLWIDTSVNPGLVTICTATTPTFSNIATGSSAPTDATYITQTTNGSLSAEQALGSLATGILKSTTVTGVVSIATAGTDYLIANQTITLSGDISGSGATAITTTLPTVNGNVGAFQGITVNAKGQVTAASNQSYLTGNQTITLSGDVTGSGTTAITATVPAKVPTGAVTLYGAAAAPTGWLLCDGTAVSRTTYSALFAIISTTYGVGDGSTTFNVPNCKQKFPLGLADSGTGNTLGGTGGTIDHLHTADPPSTVTSGPSATTTSAIVVGAAASDTHTHTVDIASFNTGTANPPFIVFTYIIKT